MKVKNISESVQHFTGYPAWPAGEARDVSDAEAEILLRSPFMQDATDKPKSTKPLKGVEPEDKL